MSMKDRKIDIALCLLIICISIYIAINIFRGVPAGADVPMHLSKARFVLQHFPVIPGWDPYWYFGTPFLRFYPPMSYLLMGLTGWLTKTTIFDAYKLYSILVFTVGAVSMYLLSRELGLNRVSSAGSSILFLTSFNLYAWWMIGQIPNISSVMFTPLTLATFLFANRRRSFASASLAGFILSICVLFHLVNTFILLLIITSATLALIIAKYNHYPWFLRLIHFSTCSLSIGLIGSLVSAWWWLPFTSELSNLVMVKPTGFFKPVKAPFLTLKELFSGWAWYTGTYHVVLAVLGLAFVVSKIKRRKRKHLVPLTLLLVIIIGSIGPLLNLPISMPYRFGPYLSIALALMAGLFIDELSSLIRKIRGCRSSTLISLSICVLLISALFLISVERIPVVGRGVPRESGRKLLEENIKGYERVAGDDYYLNVFTDVSQSGGGSIETMTNEFAYTFWFYMLHNRNLSFAPFFTRNFAVKYLPYPLEGAKERFKNMYEVNVSFVELTGPHSKLILFIGDEKDYIRFFVSVAPINPQNIVLVNGGDHIENYEADTLKHFNLIYMYNFKISDVLKVKELLAHYTDMGGGVIIDTGALTRETVPPLSPVKATRIKETNLSLKSLDETILFKGVDTSKFQHFTYSIEAAVEVNPDSKVVLLDGEDPVLVHMKHGLGNIYWTGLALPYHVMRSRSLDESRFLVNLIELASKPGEMERSSAQVTYKSANPDIIEVYVSNASNKNGVWVKMSYYDGWKAYLNGKELKILLAGPNTMMVFPAQKGNYKLIFKFEKTIYRVLGEAVSLFSLISLFLICTYKTLRERREI